MSKSLKKMVQEMGQINWGDLANANAAPSSRGRTASRSRSRSRSAGRQASPTARGRSATRKASPRRFRSRSRSLAPEHGNLRQAANGSYEQYNAKSKPRRWVSVRVFNKNGDYIGPTVTYEELLEDPRFRHDMEDLYGKHWKERARMEYMIGDPRKGNLVYDPANPDDGAHYIMYDGEGWVYPADPLGKHGGPYLTEREALAVPSYRAAKAAEAAEAAAAAGVSLPEKVFAEHIQMVPESKQAEAKAEGYPKFTSAVSAAAASDPTLMSDETKLAARARRALKGFLPEAAAPAPRQKAAKKGGARRTRRKAARKSRKGTRRH